MVKRLPMSSKKLILKIRNCYVNVDLSGLEVETGDNRRAFILKDQLTAYLNDSGRVHQYSD